MSRNVRKKQHSRPPKVAKRRGSDVSSSLDLSDDGGYSAVEDITDSDEDEEDVVAVEEEHIVSNALHNVVRSSPRPVEEDEEGDDEDEEDDDDDDAESTSWDGFPSDADEALPAARGLEDPFVSGPEDSVVERRVRFDVPDSSDGESTETDDDIDHGFFPDIFVDQNSLDPSFRREIEEDLDDDNSSNSGFWDFNGTGDFSIDDGNSDIEAFIMKALEQDDDSTPVATPMIGHNLLFNADPTPIPSPAIDDDVSLDGYQTDGETTDEEDPPERPPRRKTRRENLDDSSDSEPVTLIKPQRGQPRIGRFSLDGSHKKPIAIVNPRTGKMMIFTPQKTGKRGLDLSPEQFDLQWLQPIPDASPLINSGNMMMSAMVSSNTFGDFMNTQAAGPAEAFFSLPSDSNIFGGSSDAEGEGEDEGEKNLKLEDFLTLDDFAPSSDDDDEEDNDPAEDPILCTPTCTPGRPTTAASDATSLLDHFGNNADIVGAFRRDQANHQLISRSKATRDSLAFSGPYYEGTLRGIKDGRIATTNVPISPLRKQKKMPDMASSPLAGASQKRKASGEQQWGHKRQRSISDVDLLGI
ncbi:hypothetical protein DL771_007328 [Monosporascus sp. 5C6A]|nr:hypothetical protein DL771_007328 [Monosporascus sp. 5C6A]